MSLAQLIAFGPLFNGYTWCCNNLSDNIEKYSYDLVQNICDDFIFKNIDFLDLLYEYDELVINLFSKILNDVAINCSNQNIKKIIITDKNIKYFNCSSNTLKTINLYNSKIIFLISKYVQNFNLISFGLPLNLIYLDFSDCKFNNNIFLDFEKFKKIKYIISCDNKLSEKNIKIPNNIIYVDFSNCLFSNFDIELDKLKYLIIKNNKLLTINLFKLSNLEYLDISYNYDLLFNPNNLPPNLKFLNCSRTKCLDVYNLPLSLINFDCSHTDIIKLDYLPESLEKLNCSFSMISDLSNLPIGLKFVNFAGTEFESMINTEKILPKKIKYFND